eukprot:GHVS01029657.1.p1 GENE.GHVS01029657.1~~GHVS01029657.1.p1  ORF type:complete len:166 (+),score=20.27 GHVS01029657.1:136-633(+)
MFFSFVGRVRTLMYFANRHDWRKWRYPRKEPQFPRLLPYEIGHRNLVRKYPFYRHRKLSPPFTPSCYSSAEPAAYYNSSVTISYSLDNAKCFHLLRRVMAVTHPGMQVCGKGLERNSMFSVQRSEDQVVVFRKTSELCDPSKDVPAIIRSLLPPQLQEQQQQPRS